MTCCSSGTLCFRFLLILNLWLEPLQLFQTTLNNHTADSDIFGFNVRGCLWMKVMIDESFGRTHDVDSLAITEYSSLKLQTALEKVSD